MASTIDYSIMSAGANSGAFYDSLGITASTDRRDVSEVLEMIALSDTPLLNRISWGPDSGGTRIEWLREHIGLSYMPVNNAIATTDAALSFTTCGHGLSTAELMKQVQEGTIMYHWSSTDSEHGYLVVDSIAASNTVTFQWLTTTYETSMVINDNVYIVGAIANEGSLPRRDTSRTRTVFTNEMTILRQDINITGSQQATDMHAVPNELRHQVMLRTKEMQREREKVCFLSIHTSRTSTEAGYMNGVMGHMLGYTTNANVDTTTRTLTESALNAVVANAWENGGTPATFYANASNIRKFTQWDRSRVRTVPDGKLGGFHVARYLTDIGIEIELVPVRFFPVNLGFVLDNSLIKLRAKTGRKLLLEKLGKKGDYDEWQMISEFTMEMRGHSVGKHGMFTALS